MKKPLLISSIIAAILVSVFFIVKWQHHLLTPTAEQFRNALPGESQAILEHSDYFALLLLKPTSAALTKEQEAIAFHGYCVLSKREITQSDEKQELLQALNDGIARSSRVLPPCFSPRYGIHAISGGKSADLVICFSCEQFKVYTDEGEKLSGISNTPQKAFEHLVDAAAMSSK